MSKTVEWVNQLALLSGSVFRIRKIKNCNFDLKFLFALRGQCYISSDVHIWFTFHTKFTSIKAELCKAGFLKANVGGRNIYANHLRDLAGGSAVFLKAEGMIK